MSVAGYLDVLLRPLVARPGQAGIARVADDVL
jgi:hypothetical protein